MSINVTGRIIVPSKKGQIENRFQWYAGASGLQRNEIKTIQREADFAKSCFRHESADNGVTWGEWRDISQEVYSKIGAHEISMHNANNSIIANPIHKHQVSISMQRLFINGHKECYSRYWKKAEKSLIDHLYLRIYEENGARIISQFVKYEPGEEFDEKNISNPEFIEKNHGFFGTNITVLNNGDIMFPIEIPFPALMRLDNNIDIQNVFPSCWQIMHGLLVARGVWDTEKHRYDLTFSKPIFINDLLSSRGILEPTLAELKSGRIIVVFGGSNVQHIPWNTRIELGTPGFKWYTYSDDGGRTFKDPMAWHFDTREVVYSSSTISYLIKSIKNGKIYWIGNITNPKLTYGNFPRWPLYISELDSYGNLKKDTLTMIDTKHDEESEKVELSNFYILQDRETGNIELQFFAGE